MLVESDMPRKKSSASDGMFASAGVHGLTEAAALDCCSAQGDVTKVAMGSMAEGTLAKKAVTKRAALTKRSDTRETGAGAKEGPGAGMFRDARVPARDSFTVP